jgi:putative hemolysin
MVGEKTEESFHPIDIIEVVKEKSPNGYKRIPAFVYRWLTKILHLNEINEFLTTTHNLEPIPFLNEAVKFLGIDYEVHGKENIPKDRRFIAASNHPLGGLDGVILIKVLMEETGSSRALANDFIMAVKPLRKIFIPINKIGGQARNAVSEVDKLYNNNDNVVIFPAGLCSRKVNGEIVDLTWQKHFIQKSIKHKIDILPIHFFGTNSNRFYNLARIRKFLGIKFNIEMLFLVDEMFKQRGKKFTIHIGKPIPYTTFDKSKRHLQWASYVKSIIYKLGNIH